MKTAISLRRKKCGLGGETVITSLSSVILATFFFLPLGYFSRRIERNILSAKSVTHTRHSFTAQSRGVGWRGDRLARTEAN